MVHEALMEDGSPRKGFDDETCCEAGGHMLTFAGECRNIHFLQIVFRGSWTGPSSGRKFFVFFGSKDACAVIWSQ